MIFGVFRAPETPRGDDDHVHALKVVMSKHAC
jgi:hypothetical protein